MPKEYNEICHIELNLQCVYCMEHLFLLFFSFFLFVVIFVVVVLNVPFHLAILLCSSHLSH